MWTAYVECNLWSSLYDFLFHHALCILLCNTGWVVRFYLIVTCILLVALLPAVCLIDNLHSLILHSLLTRIVFSFQKCLAAIPFTWGKKASWLTQTEQKLSSLFCIAQVLYERNGKKKKLKKNTTWRNLRFIGLILLMRRLLGLSLPSFEFLLCWSFVDSST